MKLETFRKARDLLTAGGDELWAKNNPARIWNMLTDLTEIIEAIVQKRPLRTH
jgi:hypothetical protein